MSARDRVVGVGLAPQWAGRPAERRCDRAANWTGPQSPAGIVRPTVTEDLVADEAFTRNLRWEPTTALREHEFGYGNMDHVEITRAEADVFVGRITRKLGS